MTEPWLEAPGAVLARALAGARLPHAILVHGPRGVGKRRLVDRFVQALLCGGPGGAGEPCGACRGCRLVAAGTHPDAHRIGLEGDSRQVRIDQIRELARKVALTSTEGGYQVFRVDPADRLNLAAANALLKTLEEPRAGTLLLLLAENRAALPVTVLSRCQQIAVAVPAPEQALAWLSEADGDADARALETALEAAGGSPGVALELLAEGVVAAYPQTLDDLEALAARREDPVVVAARWAGAHPALRLEWMARHLARAAWLTARGRAAEHCLTGRLDLASLTAFGAAVDRTRSLLESNLRSEQLLETLLMDWAAGRVRRPGGRSW